MKLQPMRVNGPSQSGLPREVHYVPEGRDVALCGAEAHRPRQSWEPADEATCWSCITREEKIRG